MNLDWQPIPITKYGLQYICHINSLTITTIKSPRTCLYSFTVRDANKRGKVIYDSEVDPFSEQTGDPRRIKEIAQRWLSIREGSR